MPGTGDTEQTTTTPTLAEIRARILADATLSDTRRDDWASALKGLAKAFGMPLDAIPAEPVWLRARLARLTGAMVGQSAGRWRNIRSGATGALLHVGILCVGRRHDVQPSDAWRAVLPPSRNPANGSYHLWRFGRYCTQAGIEPAAVDDSTITRYQVDLEVRTLTAEVERTAREAARAWNTIVVPVHAWAQTLTIPDNRRVFAPAWESYPESLRDDISNWQASLSSQGVFKKARLRATSIETRRRQLRAYLGALVQTDVPIKQLDSLAAVVTPENCTKALTFIYTRNGETPSVHLKQLMSLVLMIARHWVKAPQARVEKLESLAKQIGHVPPGMTERNKQRLGQLCDPKCYRAVLLLPRVLVSASKKAPKGSTQAALLMQTAVAVDILLHLQLRLSNLQKLRIGTELRSESDGMMTVMIAGEAVKNGVAITKRVAPETSALIDGYIQHYRPALTAAPSDWLFPGMQGDKPKSAGGLRDQISKAIAEYSGVEMHPHLFRHFAALLTLMRDPQAYAQVQRLLGHKNLHTTMTTYTGLETNWAHQQFDGLVASLRDQPAEACATAPGKLPRSSKQRPTKAVG